MDTLSELERMRRELARLLGLMTASEFRAFAGITEGTEVAWKKRHVGPPYVLIGTETYYPIPTLTTWANGKVRARDVVAVADLL